MILPHGFLKTWEGPGSARYERRYGVMTAYANKKRPVLFLSSGERGKCDEKGFQKVVPCICVSDGSLYYGNGFRFEIRYHALAVLNCHHIHVILKAKNTSLTEGGYLWKN